MRDEWMGYDAVALGECVRQGRINPTELLEVVIKRIERMNPTLNAVVFKCYEQARKAAADWEHSLRAGHIGQVPFPGVPFLLKNLTAEHEGSPFDQSSRALKGYVSKRDTELVARQRNSGLIIVGKTNTPEFGLVPVTEPRLYGPTRNPWDMRLTPGGSSGGSAAAVAAGIVPMAHGNDYGGSIRIPASCCGLFGLKPTRGRNSLGPLFGDLMSGFVQEHALTRTVRDSAALLDATSGPAVGDPYAAPPKKRPYLREADQEPERLTIGFLKAIPEGWCDDSRMDPDCERAVLSAAALCEDLGHTVEEIDPRLFDRPGIAAQYGTVFCCFVGHCILYWERELGRAILEEDLEPLTRLSYQAGLRTTGAKYLAAVEEIQSFSRMVANRYQEGAYDMLLTPTMPVLPTQSGDFENDPADPRKIFRLINAFVAFTRIQNMTGQPAMSVPLFWNDGNVPIGVQFAGRFGDEGALFRLAFQLERARPWANRKPPIHCDDHAMAL